MNNKKKKELSKFQKTLAIIGLILCAAGAIFGFSQSMRMSVFFSANEYRCPLYSVHSFCHLFLCRLLLQAGSEIQRTTIACKNTLASWFHNISHGSYRPTCYRALR